MSFKSLLPKEVYQPRQVMHRRDGFALEATMFVMVLMTVLMLSAYSAALSTTRTSNLDYRAAKVAYAAEGGADAILAQLADALEDGLPADVKKGYTLTLTACRASTPVGGAPHPSPPHAKYSLTLTMASPPVHKYDDIRQGSNPLLTG